MTTEEAKKYQDKGFVLPALTNIIDRTDISIDWQLLWSEIENWYGDVKKKETGEQFLKRMQAIFDLKLHP